MSCDVTVSASDFRDLHNVLCELRSIDSPRAVAIVEKMERALADAYRQGNADFDRKRKHYACIKDALLLKSEWSLHEVKDLSAPHPFEGVDHVVYKNHWGRQEVRVPITGLTWTALYVAADTAIRDSGDHHHVFIEAFTKNGSALELTTGS